jgi:hypothetical protein
MADAEIENMRRRMTEAAQADTYARERGQPAMHKLKLLPEVTALLNRNTIQSALVDPDINLLEAVRFFLEPLNDGSLPAYNIQKEMFAALGKLPVVNKDPLVASGIGKVVLFYTRSARPELAIKRQAERLISEWMRLILKRTDDYKKREVQEMEYDPTYADSFHLLPYTRTDFSSSVVCASPSAALNPQPNKPVKPHATVPLQHLYLQTALESKEVSVPTPSHQSRTVIMLLVRMVVQPLVALVRNSSGG